MAQDSIANVATKSIDVGSMFLMDLSVNESDLIGLGELDGKRTSLDNEIVFPMNLRNVTNYNKNQVANSYEFYNNYDPQLTNNTQSIDSYNKHYNQKQHHSHQKEHYHNNNQNSRNNNKNNRNHHRLEENELLLENSLDRLATIINQGIKQSSITNNSTVTILEPPSGIMSASAEHQSTTSSLSDKHFVASSSKSTSSSGSSASSCGDNNSLNSDTSYTASCSEVDDNSDHDRANTTREDSGVLDMKDLVGSQKLSNSLEDKQINNNNFSPINNKPISNNITATNLINKQSANCYVATTTTTTTKKQTINMSTDNPTNNKNHNNQNNNNHHNQSRGSKRSVSASLPIQVPTRQMKKDLHKLKLSLINKNIATPVAGNNDDKITATSSTTKANNIDEFTIADDFDEFLEQEYNENHHNHYPINEYDIEHLRADENPMKLFESIQALARSLHEDAELFGSLPPKRLLESPIRSLAFT